MKEAKSICVRERLRLEDTIPLLDGSRTGTLINCGESRNHSCTGGLVCRDQEANEEACGLGLGSASRGVQPAQVCGLVGLYVSGYVDFYLKRKRKGLEINVESWLLNGRLMWVRVLFLQLTFTCIKDEKS